MNIYTYIYIYVSHSELLDASRLQGPVAGDAKVHHGWQADAQAAHDGPGDPAANSRGLLCCSVSLKAGPLREPLTNNKRCIYVYICMYTVYIYIYMYVSVFV